MRWPSSSIAAVLVAWLIAGAASLFAVEVMMAPWRNRARDLKPRELIGTWNVTMELDQMHCPADWVPPSLCSIGRWNISTSDDDKVHATVTRASSKQVCPTALSGAVELRTRLRLHNDDGPDTVMDLYGSTNKLLTGRSIVVLLRTPGPGSNGSACISSYDVVARKLDPSQIVEVE